MIKRQKNEAKSSGFKTFTNGAEVPFYNQFWHDDNEGLYFSRGD